ncbi:MAG TPA: hypothetical protein VNS34_04270 [Rhizobiaceae bacterium]|nr:hypothetical protein [Rhizobiaceae bacterium]
MALTNYAELKAAVANWMARADLPGEAADFVALAEARLNRELDPVRLEASLSGAAGSRVVDISQLSCEHPITLFLARPGVNEVELTPKASGTFPLVATPGRPRFWAREGEAIGFDRVLDENYSFRLHFSQWHRLSDTTPTNWLLANHPDIYLAAVLVWGGLFIRDSPYAAQFQAVLNAGLPEVKNVIAQSKRGNLTVDPMLQRIGEPLRGSISSYDPGC